MRTCGAKLGIARQWAKLGARQQPHPRGAIRHGGAVTPVMTFQQCAFSHPVPYLTAVDDQFTAILVMQQVVDLPGQHQGQVLRRGIL